MFKVYFCHFLQLAPSGGLRRYRLYTDCLTLKLTDLALWEFSISMYFYEISVDFFMKRKDRFRFGYMQNVYYNQI